VYDLATRGVPKIITSDYTDLTKIARISRFRSGFGHDYSDVAERCRSMKHYFMPRSDLDWGTVVISSPLAGTIAEIRSETTFGEQIRIASSVFPAASVIILHVRRDANLAVRWRAVPGAGVFAELGGPPIGVVVPR
jgi:hypothetical protein